MIGLISDTHGFLRPEAVHALQGCERIIHAGDVGKPEILSELQRIAPVLAVRGNIDRGAWASALPASARWKPRRRACTSCTTSTSSISICEPPGSAW